jgi:hypothetical protein
MLAPAARIVIAARSNVLYAVEARLAATWGLRRLRRRHVPDALWWGRGENHAVAEARPGRDGGSLQAQRMGYGLRSLSGQHRSIGTDGR